MCSIAGASGAALADFNGSIIGLVTSNTKHSAAGSFPRWSFAIAAAQLEPIVACLHQHSNSCSSRQHAAALQKLDTDDEELHRLWRVGNLSLPLQDGSGHRARGQGAERLSQLVGQGRSGRMLAVQSRM